VVLSGASPRGKWQPAIVVTRGRTSCRLRLVGTDIYCMRPYDQLVGRCIAKNGADRPLDPAETPLSTFKHEVHHGIEN
jgi:hypothetical protein